MGIKRKVLDASNAVLRPIGFELRRQPRSRVDMQSVLEITAANSRTVNTVIDIGAAAGCWSRSAMTHFPTATFVGIEVLQEREPDLQRLKAESSKFDYVICAAGERDGDPVELCVSDDLDGTTIGGKQGRMRVVKTRNLDSIVNEKGCRGPFLLKFDTHGFEVPILNGASKTLEQSEFIVMEVYNYRHCPGTLLFYEMCAHLEKLGFRCFNLADPMQRPGDKSLWQIDLFFARSDNPVFSVSDYAAVGS